LQNALRSLREKNTNLNNNNQSKSEWQFAPTKNADAKCQHADTNVVSTQN
jgi:hypothetical protein